MGQNDLKLDAELILWETLRRMNEPAVYVLYARSGVLYVGQSVQPLARMATHVRQIERAWGKDAVPVLSVWFVRPQHAADLAMIEAVLIRRLRPLWNRVHPVPRMAGIPVATEEPVMEAVDVAIAAAIAELDLYPAPSVASV